MKIPRVLTDRRIEKEWGHACTLCGTTGGIFPRYIFISKSGIDEDGVEHTKYKGHYCRKCLKKMWKDDFKK